MSYIYPAVGAFYKDKSTCTFTVWAPGKKNVEILLNGDAIRPLTKDERGYWSTIVTDVEPGDTYLFHLDNEKALPDPASRRQPKGVHGPSAVVDRSYPWTDESWKGIPLHKMILYEIHTGTFTEQGTFKGIVSKLDYLRELGINAIELMPVVQFPGDRNWGYDGVYPFAVHEDYGGVNGLKELVNEAHHRGIAVVLDVVYNHQGPEGNYLSEFAPYFTDKYKTPWGKAINFDDAYCDGVRNFYWQNALMWLDEFHIDGLRLDAVHAIWDFSAHHFIQGLTEKVAALQEELGKKKVLIAEIDLNNPRYINPREQGGYGMDGQWIDEFHHALHSVITGEVNGYYEDFGDVSHLVHALKYSYVYTGQYSKHRKRNFGIQPTANPYGQFVVFDQNHDQIGNRMLGDRLASQVSFEALKLAAATVLLSPHVPMLFMGEEYGEKNPFQYFISHTDERLVEMVRKGRKEEFAHFNWQGHVPDPQAEETFWQCKLSWKYKDEEQAARLLGFYRHLIAFRKERIAMQGTSRESMNVWGDTDNKIIGFERRFESDYLLMLLNFGAAPAYFARPLSCSLNKVFDSSSASWNGPGEITPAKVKITQPIVMNPESVVIFEEE